MNQQERYFKNHNGTKTPWMIYSIIGINVLIYALQTVNMARLAVSPSTFGAGGEKDVKRDNAWPSFAAMTSAATLENMVLIPDDFYQAPKKRWPTILSSMFSHANLAHLLFNMVALYQFGRPLEHTLGPLNVFLIYMIGGLGTNLIYALLNRKSPIGIVGASAAISAIGAAYFLEYADRRNMQSWLLFQVAGLILASTNVGGGISYGSHLIGFVLGAIVYGLIKVNFFRKKV